MKNYKTLMLGSVATSALLLGATSTPVLAASAEIGHSKGTFYMKSKDGKWSAKPSGQIQFRYTYRAIDDAAGTNDITEMVPRRVRFGVGGRAGSKKLTYKMSFNISTSGDADVDGDPGISIFDSYLNYKFSKAVQFRAGVWKMKFTDEHSNSSAKLQFVDRSDMDGRVRMDRDMGIGIRGNLFKMLNYEATVVNGNTRKSPASSGNHSFHAHLDIQPLGKFGNPYEGDTKNSKKLKVQVSASGLVKDNVTFSTRGNQNTFISLAGAADVYGWTAGAGLKWRGFAFYGAYAQQKFVDVAEKGNSKIAGELVRGWTMEASYFLIPKKWSVAGRWEKRDLNANNVDHAGSGATIANAAGGSDVENSWGLATSYYIRGQAHKLQFDWVHIHDVDGLGDGGDRDSNDDQFRLQWQVRF